MLPSSSATLSMVWVARTCRGVRGGKSLDGGRRPDGSVGVALVLPALTDCWWWFESLLVHSGVSSATRRKATGADHKKNHGGVQMISVLILCMFHGNCAKTTRTNWEFELSIRRRSCLMEILNRDDVWLCETLVRPIGPVVPDNRYKIH